MWFVPRVLEILIMINISYSPQTLCNSSNHSSATAPYFDNTYSMSGSGYILSPKFLKFTQE